MSLAPGPEATGRRLRPAWSQPTTWCSMAVEQHEVELVIRGRGAGGASGRRPARWGGCSNPARTCSATRTSSALVVGRDHPEPGAKGQQRRALMATTRAPTSRPSSVGLHPLEHLWWDDLLGHEPRGQAWLRVVAGAWAGTPGMQTSAAMSAAVAWRPPAGGAAAGRPGLGGGGRALGGGGRALGRRIWATGAGRRRAGRRRAGRPSLCSQQIALARSPGRRRSELRRRG